MRTLITQSESEMLAFAGECARRFPSRCVVYLNGDLGAGKTTWMRGVLREMAVEDAILSPTYPLVLTYNTAKKQIAHFDLYRLSGADDFLDSGLSEEVDHADWVFIEWSEKALDCLPSPDFVFNFSIRDGLHCVHITADHAEQLGLQEQLK